MLFSPIATFFAIIEAKKNDQTQKMTIFGQFGIGYFKTLQLLDNSQHVLCVFCFIFIFDLVVGILSICGILQKITRLSMDSV
jgi:hypothetical protein